MYAQKTTLKNASGLHARPASEFVALAKSFTSQVFVRNTTCPTAVAINGKSIVRLLAEGIPVGTCVEISAEGTDEKEAVEKLAALVDSGFGEV